MIKPAYGYRIEYAGRVAVISGDTRYNENVIKYGAGADLLVHEVAAARPELMQEAYIQRIVAHHVTPREAGRVFAQAKPKLAAYTHFVMLASEQVSAAHASTRSWPRPGRAMMARSSWARTSCRSRSARPSPSPLRAIACG